MRGESEQGSTGSVTIRAYAELNDFLPREQRGMEFQYPMSGGNDLKHLVESAGIPHTEIEVILLNGSSACFGAKVSRGDRITLYPVFESVDVSPILRLRPKPLRKTSFVLDVHLGRLAVILRLIGFDALFPGDIPDGKLAEISAEQERILLTRDRMLLKRSLVTHGCFIRSSDPEEQAVEVLKRLDLFGSVKPFSRCTGCGGALEPIEKKKIISRLEPLTRAHYDEFSICEKCGKLFWKGSHYKSIIEIVDRVTGRHEFSSTR